MRRLRTALLILFVPLALVLGIWLGGHPDWLPGFARDTLVADTNGRLYEEAVDKIEADYYRKVDRDELLDTSLEKAVESLDDQFSHYFSPKEYHAFQLDTEGAFEGVGMSVTAVNEGLRVEEVYDGSPAKEGGLKRGRHHRQRQRQVAQGQDLRGVDHAHQGPGGHRGDAGPQERAHAQAQARQGGHPDRAEPRSRSRAARRSRGCSSRASRPAPATTSSRAVKKELENGAKGVVFDLRHNGGGLLNEAVEVASVFLKDGRVVSTKGRARAERMYNATGGAIASDIPVVVLVDEGSASASEIVTGALQDRKRAKIVGTRTYGKGVFQEIERLDNGGALDITVGEYFTPTGRNLGGGGVSKGAGITPDIQASDDPETEKDEALDKALETVAAG